MLSNKVINIQSKFKKKLIKNFEEDNTADKNNTFNETKLKKEINTIIKKNKRKPIDTSKLCTSMKDI